MWQTPKSRQENVCVCSKSRQENVIMYKRKIESRLQEWLETPSHKPLVVKGVRQCGKTSSVKDFAQKNFKHIVYLDFREHPEYKKFFAPNLDVDSIVMRITASMPDVEIETGETCFIFDEIQDCPKARGALKYFHLDGRYHVIATGSLLGVNGYKTKEEQREEDEASIPVGYEDIVNMYPMDFEEWLWANGIQEAVFRKLEDCLSSLVPVPEVIHLRMIQLLQQYVIVGGMPRAVTAFMDTHNIQEVVSVQNAIIEGYKTDMLKYAPQLDKPRIRECFESIPKQLSRENKKFAYAQVRANGRGRDYQGSLQWIEDAGIIRKCYNLEIPELPLDGNAISEQFKVYMADTGLFISMLERETAHDILNGNLLGYKGAIFENLIADIFGKMGRKLYYYRKDSGLEVDFVMRYDGECTLVEVKASSGNVKSTKTILAHPEKYHVSRAIKLGNYNVGTSGQVTTLPLYMAFLLK